MDLLQLRYFQVTSKHENITRAANELLISQPALSKMIHNLETELGMQLFNREGKHIFLNDYGKKFLKRVNQAMNALEQGISEIKEMKNEKIEIITLYVTVGSMLLPKLVQQFRAQFSNIRFNLTQHPILSKKGFAYDFAITSEQIEENDHIVLLEEEILLGVPLSHPLSSLDSISLKDLEKEKFISLTNGQPLRKTTDRFFAQTNYYPDIIFESDDPATVRGLIQSGLGISFIPSVLWRNVVTEQIKLLHICEPQCKRTIYLSWPTRQSLTEVEHLFSDFTILFFLQQKRDAT